MALSVAIVVHFRPVLIAEMIIFDIFDMFSIIKFEFFFDMLMVVVVVVVVVVV